MSPRAWLGTAAALAVFALAGPRARMGSLDAVPAVGEDVEAHLRASEAAFPDIRPGDAKRIVWADPARGARTPLSLVYLHGFSADSHEVEPLVTGLGQRLGANVYFTRLAGHGRTPEAMGEASIDAWLRDVAEGMEIGRRLGERVVLIGTSTGGTLATWAAMQADVAEGLAALVLLSPNFHPRNRSTRLLLWPWGRWIARVAQGPERCFEVRSEAQARHWTSCYPTSALLPMMALVEDVRTSDLSRVRVPTLVLYASTDQVVDPAETERAFAAFGSPDKALQRIENPGDPDGHVIAGDVLSPGATPEIEDRIAAFLTASGAWSGPPH
jgi:esterase/lipase